MYYKHIIYWSVIIYLAPKYDPSMVLPAKKSISWPDRVYSPLGKYEWKNKGAVAWRNAY